MQICNYAEVVFPIRRQLQVNINSNVWYYVDFCKKKQLPAQWKSQFLLGSVPLHLLPRFLLLVFLQSRSYTEEKLSFYAKFSEFYLLI